MCNKTVSGNVINMEGQKTALKSYPRKTFKYLEERFAFYFMKNRNLVCDIEKFEKC